MIDLLSVIHTSHLDHISSICDVLINLMLSPKNPFFDKKNRVAGFALPNSSKPISVNVCSGFSCMILCKSVNVV
jgi:hypothetical protein